MIKSFKWTVEFTVDECWVADGFELTEDVAKSMIEHMLPYAYYIETSAKIVSSPDQKDIRKTQGYENA